MLGYRSNLSRQPLGPHCSPPNSGGARAPTRSAAAAPAARTLRSGRSGAMRAPLEPPLARHSNPVRVRPRAQRHMGGGGRGAASALQESTAEASLNRRPEAHARTRSAARGRAARGVGPLRSGGCCRARAPSDPLHARRMHLLCARVPLLCSSLSAPLSRATTRRVVPLRASFLTCAPCHGPLARHAQDKQLRRDVGVIPRVFF